MKKNILLLLAIVLAAVFLVQGVQLQSVDDYYLEHLEDVTPNAQTVTMSIRCDTVLENYCALEPALQSADYIPQNGIVLPTTEYVLREGDTVFSILSRAARHEKIQLEYQGAEENSYGTVYIQGIHHLYEFSCGPLSGWMYRVNGEFPSKGCSEYQLKNGDQIEWVYTCNLGQDVGCSTQE